MLAQSALHISLGPADLELTLPAFRVQMIMDDMGFAQKTLPRVTGWHLENMRKKGARQVEINKALLVVKGVGQKIDVGHKLYTGRPHTLDTAIHIVHLAIAIDKQNLYADLMRKGRIKHHFNRGLFDGSMPDSTLKTIEEKHFLPLAGCPFFVSKSACQNI